jgi:hypothetical protein
MIFHTNLNLYPIRPTVRFINSVWSILVIFLVSCGSLKEATDDGYSENAPDMLFYAATGEECCGEDPHPVHGVESSDGGFILCGKSIDSEGGLDGFLLKIGPSLPSGTVFLEEEGEQSYSWAQTFGSSGTWEVANSVTTTQDAVFVAGMETTSNGIGHRSLRKYDLVSGGLLWATTFASSTQGMDSAFESIQSTVDGGVIIAGYSNAEPGSAEGFKSFGNPIGGTANIMYFAAELLENSDAPSGPSWEQIYRGIGSIRSIRPVIEGGYVFTASQTEELYVATRINDQGEETWRTPLSDHGEATDLAVLSVDGISTGVAVVGHKSENEGIDGSVTSMDMDGTIQWSQLYGNPIGGINEFFGLDAGNPKLIYDECWGIQSNNQGGAVIACGTGIEGCDEYGIGTAIRSECNSDPRTTWRSLLIEFDSTGSEIWHRTDSYYFDSEEDAAATASEHVIRTEAGNYASVMDQDFGIGLLVLDIVP